ncbi:hypothetical protein [Plantactinospora sp. CA-290183]|uniref:hypothetical protein n=1 Tax=Plantactinospora sp. CA-290183 TaxID=3240006 RepID=UPI003D8C8953
MSNEREPVVGFGFREVAVDQGKTAPAGWGVRYVAVLANSAAVAADHDRPDAATDRLVGPSTFAQGHEVVVGRHAVVAVEVEVGYCFAASDGCCGSGEMYCGAAADDREKHRCAVDLDSVRSVCHELHPGYIVRAVIR